MHEWVWSVLVVLVIMFPVFLVLHTDISITRGHYTLVMKNDFELVAFANSSQMQGSFFLLGGVVNEEPVYYAMQRNPDGGVWQSTIPAGPDTMIYETSDCTPHVVVSSKKSTRWPYWCLSRRHDLVYQIYIPEGSIWTGYDVDIREN